jgi:hypothetical protein
MRSLVGIALVGFGFVVACHSSDRVDSAASDRTVVPERQVESGVVSRATLVADIRDIYERRIQGNLEAPASEWRVFDNQRRSPSSGLRGDALAAAREYARTRMGEGAHNVGDVVVIDGTMDGQPVTFVAGDLSDTGTEISFHDAASGAVHRTVDTVRRYPRSEYGFYDAAGKLLARAYRGQGEEPNAQGVDWTD